jgi:hypothetical protein
MKLTKVAILTAASKKSIGSGWYETSSTEYLDAYHMRSQKEIADRSDPTVCIMTETYHTISNSNKTSKTG